HGGSRAAICLEVIDMSQSQGSRPGAGISARISEAINKASLVFVTVALMVMTAAMFAQVFARDVLHSGIVWAEELSRYLMVWMVFIGAAIATYEGGQISVTALEEVLPERFRRWLRLLQDALAVVYSVVVVYIGWQVVKVVSMQTSPNIGLAMSYAYAAMPVSAAVMIIHVFSRWTGQGLKKEV
ncbi:MAG: TRAP transporter small permease, partial [Syntrophothermus sp.]